MSSRRRQLAARSAICAAPQSETTGVSSSTRARRPAAWEGVILDPFAGAGSTLAAAEAVGYESVGIEKDVHYFEMACEAVPKLRNSSPMEIRAAVDPVLPEFLYAVFVQGSGPGAKFAAGVPPEVFGRHMTEIDFREGHGPPFVAGSVSVSTS